MAVKPLVRIYNEHTSSWVDLPCPSEYSGISTTLVDSGRNADGEIIGQVILSDIAKIEMKWNFLTCAQYSTLAKLFEPKYNGSFINKVEFFDTIKNDWDNTRFFYCGDRKVQVGHIKLSETTGAPIGYTNVSLNLIDTGRR